jgi:hypothetical protein
MHNGEAGARGGNRLMGFSSHMSRRVMPMLLPTPLNTWSARERVVMIVAGEGGDDCGGRGW